MKPNNLVAVLVVVILLAIGIVLAVINSRSESKTSTQVSGNVFKDHGQPSIHHVGQNDANLG